jgi:hypothetical protein
MNVGKIINMYTDTEQNIFLCKEKLNKVIVVNLGVILKRDGSKPLLGHIPPIIRAGLNMLNV